jgi:hypothetical protein
LQAKIVAEHVVPYHGRETLARMIEAAAMDVTLRAVMRDSDGRRALVPARVPSLSS